MQLVKVSFNVVNGDQYAKDMIVPADCLADTIRDIGLNIPVSKVTDIKIEPVGVLMSHHIRNKYKELLDFIWANTGITHHPDFTTTYDTELSKEELLYNLRKAMYDIGEFT